MNIKFTNLKKQPKTLGGLEEGVIFSPINSLRIFLKLDKTSLSDIFATSDTRLLNYWENLQGNTFNLYDDLIACVDLSIGKLLFLHADDKVVKLEHELIIENEIN